MTKKIEHVAIIMDGNGRWAQKRLRPRVWGHVRGARTVSKIVEASRVRGLKSITLYAFSTENWSRPLEEITTLFKLLKKYLQNESGNIIRNGIRFKIVGSVEGLDDHTKELITDLEARSAHNTGLILAFAFNYGGRKEITDAVNRFIANNPGKSITEDDISVNLYLPEIADVDLLIRTAGEQRLSNFLLWQNSYAEFYFTDTKWPDFTTAEYTRILDQVEMRDRRFGSLNNSSSLASSQVVAKNNLEALG